MEWKFIAVLTGLVLLIALLIPTTRLILAQIFGALSSQAFLAILQTLVMWSIAIMKKVWIAHWNLFNHLRLPRSIIFPTVEKDE